MKKIQALILIVVISVTASMAIGVSNFSASTVLSLAYDTLEKSISFTSWNTRISKGLVPGAIVVHKFGRNPDIGTAIEDLNQLGGVRTWMQTAATMEAISADADDTVAGAGGRVVTIQGLDETFAMAEEDINMAGLSASDPTTTTFIRVYRAFVKQTGVYDTTTTGSHQGTITIRVSGAGANQIIIPFEDGAGFGQSNSSAFTCPVLKTCLINRVTTYVESLKPARVILFVREDADDIVAPMTSKRQRFETDATQGQNEVNFDAPIRIPGKSDIWFSAIADQANTTIGVHYEILIID